MKAFSIPRPQIAIVAAALIADELGSAFGKHVDTLTAASWWAETPIQEGGADLSGDEAAAVRLRALRFFGVEPKAQPGTPSKIGDWVDEIAASIDRRLTSFSFAAAGENAPEYAHQADAIFAGAAAASNLLYGRRRVLSLISPHSLIGFTLTVLSPNLLNTPSVDVRGMAPDELKKFLSFGDALIATPSLWRYVIAQGIVAPDNAMAVFFGEAMTPQLSAEIRKAGFNAQREIYGSTEHGLIAWRDSPGDPFALFDHWSRCDEKLSRRAPSGEHADVEPMDRFVWEGDRRFRLGGRRDGAVQIGGINIFPERIAQRISEHPAVASCVVELSKEEAGGDRLVAAISLHENGSPAESVARSIDAWCRAKLRPHERPRLYNYVEARK